MVWSQWATFSLNYFAIFSVSYQYLNIKHQKHNFLKNVLCLRNLHLKTGKEKSLSEKKHPFTTTSLGLEEMKHICIFFVLSGWKINPPLAEMEVYLFSCCNPVVRSKREQKYDTSRSSRSSRNKQWNVYMVCKYVGMWIQKVWPTCWPSAGQQVSYQRRQEPIAHRWQST